MAVWTSPFTNNTGDQIGSKNLGLHFGSTSSIGTLDTISAVTVKVDNNPTAADLQCWIQTSSSNQQIGSTASSVSEGTYTFTAGTPIEVNADDFIIYFYQSAGTAINLGFQYDDAPTVTGVNAVYYGSSTNNPTYSSWANVYWNEPNGMYVNFTYTASLPGASSVGLPPPPIVVNF